MTRSVGVRPYFDLAVGLAGVVLAVLWLVGVVKLDWWAFVGFLIGAVRCLTLAAEGFTANGSAPDDAVE